MGAVGASSSGRRLGWLAVSGGGFRRTGGMAGRLPRSNPGAGDGGRGCRWGPRWRRPLADPSLCGAVDRRGGAGGGTVAAPRLCRLVLARRRVRGRGQSPIWPLVGGSEGPSGGWPFRCRRTHPRHNSVSLPALRHPLYRNQANEVNKPQRMIQYTMSDPSPMAVHSLLLTGSVRKPKARGLPHRYGDRRGRCRGTGGVPAGPDHQAGRRCAGLSSVSGRRPQRLRVVWVAERRP